jgi:hypothetical protein
MTTPGELAQQPPRSDQIFIGPEILAFVHDDPQVSSR